MIKFIILVVALSVPSISARFAGPTAAELGLKHIIRPCYNLRDIECIRENLAANSNCNMKVRGMPHQYVLNNFVYHTPFFNSSYVDEYLIVRNHDKCHVSEFFFNIDTDTAVLAIDCPLLDLESNRTLIQHRSLLEDTRYSYIIRGNYPLVRLTTNFPHANNLDLCSTYTHADVTALPKFFINPNNKPTYNFLTRDLSALNIYEIETFFYRAAPLFRYFVNSVLCNFGCNS